MRRFATVVAALAAVVLLSRCAIVSGLNGLEVSGDAGSPVDGATSDVAITDGSGVDVAPVDAGCTCVPIPQGWSPARYGTRVNPCPNGDVTEDVVTSPAASTATGQCDCSCTANVDCASPKVTFYATTSCTSLSTGMNLVTTGACTASGAADGTNSFLVAAPSISCTTQAAPFASTSSGTGRVCSPPSKCGANQGCNDPTPGQSSCVIANGDLACPAPYTTKTIIAASVTDTRQCTGCTCDTAAIKCNYAIENFATSGCTVAVDKTTASVGCEVFTMDTYYTAMATKVGACSATKGVASGAATPVNVRTVCCK